LSRLTAGYRTRPPYSRGTARLKAAPRRNAAIVGRSRSDASSRFPVVGTASISRPFHTYAFSGNNPVSDAVVATSFVPTATKELILYDAHDHARWLDDGVQTTADTLKPSGRMLQRTVTNDANGTSTSTAFGYQNSGDSPAYSLSDGVRTTYIGGPGGLLFVDVGGAPTYPIENGHGDIVGGVSAGGTFTSNPDVTEFGQGATSGNGLDWLGGYERFTLPGPLGLVRMGVRFYDPNLGRFLEVDPVRGGSANDYEYCGQDPVNAADIGGTFYDGNGIGADQYERLGEFRALVAGLPHDLIARAAYLGGRVGDLGRSLVTQAWFYSVRVHAGPQIGFHVIDVTSVHIVLPPATIDVGWYGYMGGTGQLFDLGTVVAGAASCAAVALAGARAGSTVPVPYATAGGAVIGCAIGIGIYAGTGTRVPLQ
jgi:RHS repeat-associated protein